MSRAAWRWTPLLLILASAGCGGEGTGLSQPARKTLDVYVTGTIAKTYAHVWVTLDKVVLTNGLTEAQVFNETPHGGLKVDLSTLSDKAGPLYLYLGSKSYDTGLFTSAKVSLGNQVTLDPSDHSGTRTLKLSDSKDAMTTVDVDLTKTSKLVPGTNLVLNLDSAAWKEKEGMVEPKVKVVSLAEGDGLMDTSRHIKQTLTGSIANLDNGVKEKAFDLTTPAGQIQVKAEQPEAKQQEAKPAEGRKSNSKTALTLFEGLQVKVTGTFDPASEIFNASSVERLQPTGLSKPFERIGKRFLSGLKH